MSHHVFHVCVDYNADTACG